MASFDDAGTSTGGSGAGTGMNPSKSQHRNRFSLPSLSGLSLTGPKDVPVVASSSSSGSASGKDGSETARFSGRANSTIVKLEDGEDDEGKSGMWRGCSASTFSLRIGPNYSRNKKKGPSADALMELVGVDLVRAATSRIDLIGSKLALPPEFLAVSGVEGQETGDPLVPPLFIVNCQVPSEFPTSLFSEVTDGPGWSIVYYYRMTSSTADQISNPERASAAVNLFAKYCREAPELDANPKSIWKGRFKAMFRTENMDEFGLPSFITAYNAKPVLINKTGTLHRGTGFIEMDINLHRFATIAKKGLQVLIPYFEKMRVTAGFTIESVEDSEMPECLFGCGTCVRVNYRLAPDFA